TMGGIRSGEGGAMADAADGATTPNGVSGTANPAIPTNTPGIGHEAGPTAAGSARSRATAGKPYELFLLYAEGDRGWVEGFLAPGLSSAGVLFTSEAAFDLGVPRIEAFEQAVERSERTLLVLSPAFLDDGLTQFSNLVAQYFGLESSTWPV